MEWINRILGGVVPVALMVGGLFFCVYLRAFHLTHPKKLIASLMGQGAGERRAAFRGLALALAGTLGVGNMVGVAAAIALGGAGAVLWMWISALCAMLLKYGETVLAMAYRKQDRNGILHGSAMHYLREGFRKRGLPLLGRLLAAVFALLCLINALTMGSMIQVHAVAGAMEDAFGVTPWITGVVLAALTFWVIRRGREGVMRWTELLVPLMSVGYLVLSLAVLIRRADALPDALWSIIADAGAPAAAGGGIVGFLLSRGIRYGTMRGLISNEAGCGTAPMAHATAENVEGAKQGIMGILEVFVDTIVLCTLTALVILVSPLDPASYGERHMSLTLDAYTVTLGQGASWFLAPAVLCFGFATVLCWAHYGRECVSYLGRGNRGQTVFTLVYTGSVLLGSVVASGVVWQLADLAIGLMTLINLWALLLMRKEIKQETIRWLQQ